MASTREQVVSDYGIAKERFAAINVDTDAALKQLGNISISLHCWQGDDVGGFEGSADALGGGLAVTGNYLGKARSADELRTDLEFALKLIPGHHRVNLHAIYGETEGKRVERTDLEPKHFERWIDWAKQHQLGLDFNPTYFSHPLADSGFTLSHRDESIRRYWIEHGIACRKIGAAMGRALGTPCVTNVWIPDGSKDLTADRRMPRERLRDSLDAIFAEKINPAHHLDAVESKLFGIGSETYVVGSHEFYLGYALKKGVLLCLDMGHFHPTESVADKISATLTWLDEILLHVSRGVRWDSDHVVILNDDVRALMQEIVRGNYLNRTRIALDYFDASINRVAAWVIGTRATLKSLLLALLEPSDVLRKYEVEGDYTSRLAVFEHLNTMPWGTVWKYYCEMNGTPDVLAGLKSIKTFERDVLTQRGQHKA